MDLSVIIVNYNVRQFLENALTSIFCAMEGLQGEVFVVDNASDDGSAAMVREKFPSVQLIANRENVGFARANNQALARARGRLLLLINPDTVVQEDTFKVMVRFFDEHPEAGLAGCRILNPDGTLQLACRRSFPTPWVAFTKTFGLSALFPGSRLFGKYNLTYLDPEKTAAVDAVSGSFMMIRRTVCEQIGGLDERFFMYGEDLDWCYRVARAGYQVFYVPTTRIIHFKGESTRRSNINELIHFYDAMRLFVEKHFSNSSFVKFILYLGIVFRGGMAAIARSGPWLFSVAADVVLVDLALALSAFLYFRDPWLFPRSANPVIWVLPALLVLLANGAAGVYTTFRNSISRTVVGVISGYVLISALVFFAKGIAYSRAVVLISSLISLLLLPGWRLLARLIGPSVFATGRKSLFGRRTVIVGTGASAQEVLRRLRARVDDGYDIVGFLDLDHSRIGEKIAGTEIIGSIGNAGKVIDAYRVSEVIFSTEQLSYADILSVIARSSNRDVNFRLVPNSLEAIIGKTRIDDLDTLPLVEIDYNIRKPSHRIMKRLFDLAIALPLLVMLSPVVVLWSLFTGPAKRGAFVRTVLAIPRIVAGKISIVGRPMEGGHTIAGLMNGDLGPDGLTGLVQINMRDDLTADERERYLLYYAKNQSFILDVEILLKSIALMFQQRRK